MVPKFFSSVFNFSSNFHGRPRGRLVLRMRVELELVFMWAWILQIKWRSDGGEADEHGWQVYVHF